MSTMLPAAALRLIDLEDKIAKYDISPEENGSHKITIDFGGDGDVPLIPTIPLLARLRKIFEQSKHIVLLNETWDADVHSITFRVNMNNLQQQQQQHDSIPGPPQSPPSVPNFGERSLIGSVISDSVISSGGGGREQIALDAGENIADMPSSSSQKPARCAGAAKARGRPRKETVCSPSSSSSAAKKCKRPASVGELSETATVTTEADVDTTERMCTGPRKKRVAELPVKPLEAADFEKILREVHERREKTGRITVPFVMKRYNFDRAQALAVVKKKKHIELSTAAKTLAKRFRNLAKRSELQACRQNFSSSQPSPSCKRSYKKKQKPNISDSETEVSHEEPASQAGEAALVNKTNTAARRRGRQPRKILYTLHDTKKTSPPMLSRQKSRAQLVASPLADDEPSSVVHGETRFDYQHISEANIVHGTRARKQPPRFRSRSRSSSLRMLQSVVDLADSESDSDSLPHSQATPDKSADVVAQACNKQKGIATETVAGSDVAAVQPRSPHARPMREVLSCAAVFSVPNKPAVQNFSASTSSPPRGSAPSCDKVRLRALVTEADLCRKSNRSLTEHARNAQAKLMAGKFSVSEKSALKILNVVTGTHADKSVDECVEILFKKLRSVHNGGDSSDDSRSSVDRQSSSLLIPGAKRGADAVSSANTSIRSITSSTSVTSPSAPTFSRFVPPTVQVTSSAHAVLSHNISDAAAAAASRRTGAKNSIRGARFLKVEDTSDSSMFESAVSADVKPTSSSSSLASPKTTTAVPVPSSRAPEASINRHNDDHVDGDDDIQILTASHGERMLILKILMEKKPYPPASAKDIANKLLMSVSELGQFITRFLPDSRPYVRFDVSV